MRLDADALAAALAARAPGDAPALPGRTNHLRAGVLVPLRLDPPVAVLTLRTKTLRRHAGEVSFPGGKPDPGDRDLEATALREAREELGIEGARVLGRLTSVPLFTSDWRLVPYVAAIDDRPLRPHPGEVARVLELRLDELLARPHLEALFWAWEDQAGLSPVFPFPDGPVLYGGTAHAFLELLEVCAPLLGLGVPPLKEGAYRWEDLLPKSL